MSNLRTAVYVALTCVAIFAVWYVGNSSSHHLRQVQYRDCRQVASLTDAVNDLHGSLKKFLIAARDARLKSPHTKINLQAARDYQVILNHIKLVDPPDCQQP